MTKPDEGKLEFKLSHYKKNILVISEKNMLVLKSNKFWKAIG